MSQDATFYVVLTNLNEPFRSHSDAVGSVLASTFNFPEKKGIQAVNLLPVILFSKLSVHHLKSVKDALLFLTKMGLEFNITPKKPREVADLGLRFAPSKPIVTCPCCNEKFILARADDLLHANSALAKEKTPQPAEDEDMSHISAEFEQVEEGDLSAELDRIVGGEDDIDEIEEVGSISEELEEIGSFSEELEKIGDFSDELEKIGHGEEHSSSSVSVESELSQGDSLAMEDIGGISAEFEEIEGVSAEFEKISLEHMEEDIGSLSAELEEIEGISAEFDRISDGELEKIEVIGDSGGKINLAGIKKTSTHGIDDTADYELEEIEDISAELERIAEPLDESLLDNENEGNEGEGNKGEGNEESQQKEDPAPTPSKPEAKKASPAPARSTSESTTDSSSSDKPAQEDKKSVSRPLPKKFRAKAPATLSPHGPYSVWVNFAGPGDLEQGVKALAQVKGISIAEAKDLVNQKTSIRVVTQVSLQVARSILERFKKLKMQGKIVEQKSQ